MTEPVKILTGDCRDVLKTLQPKSIDALVADPPYGTASKTKIQKRGTNSLEEFNIDWDQDLPLEWLKIARPLLKDGASFLIFTDNKQVTTLWEALEDAGYSPLQTFYWVKKNPPPQPRKNFCSSVETAIFGRVVGSVNFWGGGGASPNCFQTALVAGAERTCHPTQKPVNLMKHILSIIAPPGGTVLDPFMGSGTTGVAAVAGGWQFIGIERDPEFFAVAQSRIGQVLGNPQLKLLR